MSMYQVFVSGSSVRDLASLAAAVRNVEPSAQCYQVDKIFTVASDVLLTPLQVAGIQSAIDSAPTATPELAAQAFVDRLPVFEKALILTLLDQINVLRSKVGLGTVTGQQAIQAVRDKAATL